MTIRLNRLCCETIWSITLIFSIVLLVSFIEGCGIKEEPHYRRDKNYGKEPEASTEEESDQNLNPEPQNPTNNAPQVETDEGETEVSVDLKPDSVVYRAYFKGQLDPSSLRFLQDDPSSGAGVVIDPNENGVGPTANSLLSALQKTVDVVVEQNYGDGVSRSRFSQHVVSALDEGLLGSLFDDAGDSGVMHMDRHVESEIERPCPNEFGCFDRMTILPTQGKARTFCFYDAKGRARSIPSGLSPTASKEEVSKLFGVYGPFTVYRFSDADIQCETVDRKLAQSFKRINVKISDASSQIPGMKFFSQKPGVIKITHGVRFDIQSVKADGSLFQDVNRKPYLDQEIGQQGSTTYFVNEERKDFVKLVKQVRKPFKRSYTMPDWMRAVLPSRVSSYLIFDGMVVDFHVEFCQDLSDLKSTDYCK